jgi:predicted nucleic acid-binding protein
MIVVDTSVWISVLRPRVGKTSKEARAFTALLDEDEILLPAPVRTELLGGVRPAHRPTLRRILTALPVAYPTHETWQQMDQWAIHGAERGQSFGVGDLLIGATAREAGALVWSLDHDFERMAELNFIDLYEP